MSHTFTVAGGGALQVAELHERFGFPGLRFREGTDLPKGGGWPRGINHVYLHGVSTRPIETTYDGESLEVRILTCTDPTTVQLACKLAVHAARQGAGRVTSEDHSGDLSVPDFERAYGDDWAAEHARTGFDMMRRIIKQNGAGQSSMSGTTATLELGPSAKASLPTALEEFEEELSYRFRLLNYPDEHNVFFGSVIVVSSRDESRVVRLASYVAVPTMLPAKADLVVLGRDEEMLHVPLANFVELCGERGRWISESLYLAPELGAEEFAALLERARPLAVSDMFAHGRTAAEEAALQPPASSDESPEATAQAIARIPAMVFLLVASADGKIELKEIKVFQSRLKQLLKVPNASLAEIMAVSQRMFEPAVQDAIEGKLDPVRALSDGAEALERAFPPQASEVLKKLYLAIGLEVANASATGFFRKKIRDGEATALAMVATLLRVPVPEA